MAKLAQLTNLKELCQDCQVCQRKFLQVKTSPRNDSFGNEALFFMPAFRLAEFTTADLIKLRARKGQSVKGSAISMVLNRWKTNRKIEKVSEAKYKKL